MGEPSSALVAGWQALVVAGLALGLGYLVVDAAFRLLRVAADGALLWGLALFGFLSVSGIVMLAHIATRGAVLSNRAVVWAIVTVLAAASVGVRILLEPPEVERAPRSRWLWGVLILLAGLAVVVWCLPVFQSLPLDFRGDTKAHAIRATQLLIGNSTPAAHITGAIPNDYPYFFHFVVATLAHFTPGHRIFHAYNPLMVLLVVGGALSFYALGRELTDRWTGGVFMSVFGALSGGFGWLVSGGPAVIFEIRRGLAARYLGDMMSRRSYNLAFHNLVPPFPRDLTYVLIGSYFLLLVLGVKRRSVRLLVGAGIVSGLLGLAGGEAFFVSLGVSGLVALFARGRRISSGAALFVPALGLYAVWAAPMIVNYLRYGGFVDLSAAAVALPPGAILGSWGSTTLFALIGAPLVVRRVKADHFLLIPVFAVVVPAVVVLVTTLGGDSLPRGLSTLGRPHRYWPLVYLAVAMFGAAGAAFVMHRLRRATPIAPVVASLLVIASAAASPILAGHAYADEPFTFPRGVVVLREALVGRPDSLLLELSPRPEGNCSVAVPAYLSRAVPAFSGYRVVYYPGRADQQARIRWPDIDTVPREQRDLDNTDLVNGRVEASRLDVLIDRYGLDAIVIPPGVAPAPAYAPYEKVLARTREVVVWIDPSCKEERFRPPDQVVPPTAKARE